MADANQAAEELARTLQKLNEELALNGKATIQTQNDIRDAQLKAKYGIENYTKGTEKAAEGVMALGRAGFAAGKAMLDGKKGAAALNSSLDELSTAATAAGAALALMIPGGFLIKGLIAGVTMATTAYIKYTQAANEMADQLHKGYVGLAKAGGAAADGMTGLKNDAQKLGLAMGELDQLVSLVTENSKDFALFAGSVSDGRKKFADLGQAMTPAREGLLNLGLEVKDINEGMAGYVRLQTRLGNAQSMSVNQLAKGAQEYLKEQDALTKLTGQSRAEMEQQRERALQKEQFAAKVRELQLNGQKEAAENLLKLNSIYEAAGPETASAFQASVTGNLSNRDAQKANLASQGEMIRSTQMVIDGQISYQEAAQRTGKAMSATADTVGTTLGQLGVYNENFGNLAEQIKLGQLAQGDIVANYDKIKAEQAKQMSAADPLVKKQTELIMTQIEANQAMTNFIFEGIVPAQEKMIALAKATGSAAEGLAGIAGGRATTGEKLAAAGAGAGAGALTGAALGSVVPFIGTAVGGAIGAVLGGAGGYLFAGRNEAPNPKDVGKKGSVEAVDTANIPKAADGGLLTGPTSGYLAMLHGTELVIPEDQLMGKVSAGGMAGAGGEQLAKMNNLYNEMLKDTVALEKLTDQDLRKTRDFSRLSDRLRTLKTSLIEDEIELLEEQNDLLEKLVQTAEAASPGAGQGIRKSFNMMRSLGMNMGGGAMPNLPSMGGGQGLSSASTDLLQFGGESGSASNFEGLNNRLKTAVLNAASEYNAVTGKKLKINSAKRDSDDQMRLYKETVDAGRPGIGPSGMPVGKPGTSAHERGLAVDIQNYNDPAALSALNRQGLQQVIPKDPVHFQLSGETGMIADGPETGYQATLHGKEAVIPMQNNSGDFVKMFASMAESSAKMVDMMEQMITAQKNSVDVQTKMLRAQS